MCAHILKITLYLKGKQTKCVAFTSYMEVKLHSVVYIKLPTIHYAYNFREECQRTSKGVRI